MTPTLEQLDARLLRVEQHLGFIEDPEPSEWEEIIRLETAGVDTYALPYTAFGNLTDALYYQKGQEYRKRHLSGDDATTAIAIRGTNYVHMGKVYATCHRWFSGLPYSYFYIDGQAVATHRYPMGEDRTLYHDGSQWIMFIRSHPYYERKMSLQMSPDFRTWSAPQSVSIGRLAENERAYSMTPFKIDGEYYAIVNVYQLGDNGENESQLPPYGSAEHTITPYLYQCMGHIRDWQIVNESLFPSLVEPGLMQCFATPVVKDGFVYLTTIESKRKHTNWCNANESATKPYFSRVLKTSVTDFKRKFIQ